MRMGKGKGKRGRLQARVWPFSWLLAFTTLRPGLLHRLFTFTQARCSFKVGVTYYTFTAPAPLPPRSQAWLLSLGLQRFYLRKQLALANENTARVRRRPLSFFYHKLYYWHGLVPHAIVSRPDRFLRRTWRYLGRTRRTRLLSLAYPQRLGFIRQLRS
jgi:hypothetical protein